MAEALKAIDQNDHRHFDRIDSDSTVFLLLGGGRSPAQVKLKNWSSAGACATLEKGCLLPREFSFLRSVGGGEMVRVNCVLIWQVGNEAGFRFSMKPNDGGASSS